MFECKGKKGRQSQNKVFFVNLLRTSVLSNDEESSSLHKRHKATLGNRKVLFFFTVIVNHTTPKGNFTIIKGKRTLQI